MKVDVEYLESGESRSMEKSEAELKQRISFLTENLRKEKAKKEEANRQRSRRAGEKKALIKRETVTLTAVKRAVKTQRGKLLKSADMRRTAEEADTAEATIRMSSMDGTLRMSRSRWTR